MQPSRSVMVLAALAIASCQGGEHEAPAADVAPAFAMPTTQPPAVPVTPPPAVPVCQAAREYFGAYATCTETPLPDLETAAGSLIRVGNASDPSWRHVYVLVKPSGELAVGLGGDTGDHILDEILPALVVSTTPADLLARLVAEVKVESAIVRCLPGTDDVLPSTPGLPDIPCTPPSLTFDGDHAQLTFLAERFRDPAGSLRDDDHWLWRETMEFVGGLQNGGVGEGLRRLDPDAPRPPSLPPLPGMTRPPSYAGAPVAASRSVTDVLCRTAREELTDLVGYRCEAFAYPSLKLPTGALFFLSNDAGLQYLMALRKPDGTIVVEPFDTSSAVFGPIISSRDVTAIRPEQLLAARFLISGTPARVRCLPGDVIPGVPCAAPSAWFDGDKLVISAVVESLPLAQAHGTADEPEIKSGLWVLSPTGYSVRNGRILVRDGVVQ